MMFEINFRSLYDYELLRTYVGASKIVFGHLGNVYGTVIVGYLIFVIHL